MVDAGAHVADGIDGKDRQMVAIDVDADREEGVGVDLKLDRRLSPQTMAPPGFYDQAFVEQAIDDAGDRRLGEAGLPGDFGARNRRLPMDATQNDASIVLARILDIGSRQVGRQFDTGRLVYPRDSLSVWHAQTGLTPSPSRWSWSQGSAVAATGMPRSPVRRR
ncbi:hypothetical protein RsS93_41480 [Rhizobium dioscoreae]|uniref:Uncharacterized protein n=1 Tax=Rhizobium dioscoreae TaxID=2653122 RepID=A0ABQ0Z8B5_9HYPH|nr:hypothetical protein RsS93_41480 [Rhizobium dioscoreae]